MKYQGLRVSIFKTEGKSYSNNGISARFDEALVVGEDIAPIFGNDDGKLPVIRLERGAFAGTVIAKVVYDPSGAHEGKVLAMYGGCFVSTSDSRFSEAARKIVGGEFYGAVPLHDRFEY